jgi:hypothetical protein
VVDLGENSVGGLDPHERFGAGVVLGEIALMAACRSAIERQTPRRMRCRVILKLWIALSQEAKVGVKWKVQRGWRASQASTLGCL